MTRVVLLKCGQCSKQIEIGELDQATASKAIEWMPANWRRTRIDLGGGASSIADVCSFKCSVTWARDRIVEAIETAERMGQYIDED